MSSRAEEVRRGRSRSHSKDRYHEKERKASPGRRDDDRHRDRRRDDEDHRRRSRSPRRRTRSGSRSRADVAGSSRKPARSRSRSRSHSPDHDRRKHRDRSREKRRRSRSRSSSVSSSSSDDSGHEKRKKKKEKHHKRRRSRSRDRSKKEKKKEKKSKKKHHKSAASSHQWGKYGLINETDLYNKEQEFRAWLVEERKINPETISKDQNKKEFARFVEDYNTATLPHEKFYAMDAYERRMDAVRSGAYIPPADDGYNPDADLRALQTSQKRKPTEQDTYMSKEQLMELRRVQAERIEAGKMKLLGMDVKQNMGVRMDGTMFDG